MTNDHGPQPQTDENRKRRSGIYATPKTLKRKETRREMKGRRLLRISPLMRTACFSESLEGGEGKGGVLLHSADSKTEYGGVKMVLLWK